MATEKRYDCLESGCSWSITTDDDAALVAAVQAHTGEAHASFELEEIVLANARELGADDGARR